MSDDHQPKQHAIVDLRMVPVALLALVLAGVVSYSIGANFGMRFVPIDLLPEVAASLKEFD